MSVHVEVDPSALSVVADNCAARWPWPRTSCTSERTGRSLAITANRAASDWYSLFPKPVVAESILDRVVNGAHHLHMPGRSFRPNHRPGAGAS